MKGLRITTTNETPFRIAGVLAEIQAEYLPQLSVTIMPTH
jgi:hypothetical protein